MDTRPDAAGGTDTGLTLPLQTIPLRAPAASRKAGLLARLRGRAFGRMGWGLADQAVSSLTNVVVSFYLAHTLDTSAFGAFGLAYLTYGFALSASRGISTDPLMVRFSGVEAARWRRAVAGATGTAIVTGLVLGTVSMAAAIAIRGVTGSAFFALGLTLPGLLLQDSWRYSFFAHGRGGQAFLNDTIWAVVMLPAIAVLRLTGHADVFWVVFAWGAAACVGGLAGPLQARVRPRVMGSWTWIQRHRDLGPRYLAEGTIGNSGYLVRGWGTRLLLSLSAVGALQGSVTIFGPTTILFAAMGLVTIPEAARVLRRAPAQLGLACAAISGGLAALGLAWGAVLLVAMPKGLGHLMLGSTLWRETYPLVLPTTIGTVGAAIGIGSGAGLHALGASRKSLRLMIVATAAFIGFSLAGAKLDGIAGVCWGAALSSWLSTAVSWSQLRSALREAGVPHSALSRMIRRRFRSRVVRAVLRQPVAAPAGPPVALARAPAGEVPARHTRRQGTTAYAAVGKTVLAGVAGLAVITMAGFGGAALAHETDRPGSAGTPAAADPAARPGPARTPAGVPAAPTTPLAPVSATVFEPYGGSDNSATARFAIDGNPGTAWSSSWYTTAEFGGLKRGMGLLLDMGRPVTVTAVGLLLGDTPGADIQIRVGDSAGPLAALPSVAQTADAAGRLNVQAATPAQGRYVLIWFTRLPPDPAGTFQATVYQVTVEGSR